MPRGAAASSAVRSGDHHGGDEHAGGGSEPDDSRESSDARGIPESLPYQARLRALYTSSQVQMGVAALIFINFIIAAVEKQILPEPATQAARTLDGFEVLFAVLFGVELIWNMYAHWLSYFWRSYARSERQALVCCGRPTARRATDLPLVDCAR
jgi:hypothetical protein